MVGFGARAPFDVSSVTAVYCRRPHLADPASSGEGFCEDAGCSAGDYQRFFTAGSVVGTVVPETPVPEPATLTLTVLGAAGVVARLRRRLRAKVND
jgi:hypothetical protein